MLLAVATRSLRLFSALLASLRLSVCAHTLTKAAPLRLLHVPGADALRVPGAACARGGSHTGRSLEAVACARGRLGAAAHSEPSRVCAMGQAGRDREARLAGCPVLCGWGRPYHVIGARWVQLGRLGRIARSDRQGVLYQPGHEPDAMGETKRPSSCPAAPRPPPWSVPFSTTL